MTLQVTTNLSAKERATTYSRGPLLPFEFAPFGKKSTTISIWNDDFARESDSYSYVKTDGGRQPSK
jgi:hypothetical protein